MSHVQWNLNNYKRILDVNNSISYIWVDTETVKFRVAKGKGRERRKRKRERHTRCDLIVISFSGLCPILDIWVILNYHGALSGQYAYTFGSLVRWRVGVCDGKYVSERFLQKFSKDGIEFSVTGKARRGFIVIWSSMNLKKKNVGIWIWECFVTLPQEWGRELFGTGRSQTRL